MTILLIAISFLTALIKFWLSGYPGQTPFRTAFIKSSVVHGLLIAISIEGLSFVNSLTFEAIVTFWGLCAFVNLSLMTVTFRNTTHRIQLPSLNSFSSLGVSERIAIGAICFISTVSLVLGFETAPNNWDSLSYHLPRIMHWIQNQSVAHYPTHDLLQISMSPGVEYMITHLQILAGGDRFANFVQWLAFLGSVLGMSAIANKVIGCQSQWISGLVCASVPMAIMQSTTTQTDLTAAFWLVCFTYFMLRTDTYTRADFLWLGASSGLALLTKPTVLLFGAPFFGIFIFRLFKDRRRRSSRQDRALAMFQALVLSTILLTITVSLSLPAYWRNYQTFGSVLGVDHGTRTTAQGVPHLLSNVLKNVACNLPIPGIWQLVDLAHNRLLELDIDDPDLTFIRAPRTWIEQIKPLAPHEDHAGAPIHLLLGLFAFFVLISKLSAPGHGKKKIGEELLSISLACLAGFLAFCLLLKWQVWGNRLLLPLVILYTPITAFYLSGMKSRKVQLAVIILLALSGSAYALTPMKHPLIRLPISDDSQAPSVFSMSRAKTYFSGSTRHFQLPYQEASQRLAEGSKCGSIGFHSLKTVMNLEYLIWVTLQMNGPENVRIKNINVTNVSQELPAEFPDSELCAVISNDYLYDPNQYLAHAGKWIEVYEGTRESGAYLKVFIRL